MDFFEKLNELHAKEVSPKEFKEINGVSQKKVMKNVMKFVDEFDAKQTEPKKSKKGKVATMRTAAMPLDPAAVVLDPVAAKPAAAKKRAVPARAAKAAARPADVLAARIAKALAAAGIAVPKTGKAGDRVRILGRPGTSTLGEIIEVKLEEKNGVLVVTTDKGEKGLPGRVAASKTGIEKFVESVKGVEGIGIKGIKFVEGRPGLIKKAKGEGLVTKVAKGPKGGGPGMK